MLANDFGNTAPQLKFSSCAGAALDKSCDAGYKRAYWTKGIITAEGLMYLPHKVNNISGPAELNLSGQTMDGRAPAFAALREPHLRPKDTFGHDRRFRKEERLGMIKSGIHDLVLPGPGTYIRSEERSKRFVDNSMIAPANGELHSSNAPSQARTSFGSTATGINCDPDKRCDTPRGRNSWINGGLVTSKSAAPPVSMQNTPQTTKVMSNHFADLSRNSSFLHSSFNSTAQKGARYPLRKQVLDKKAGALDTRGRPKMDRFAPQPPELSRTVNTMT